MSPKIVLPSQAHTVNKHSNTTVKLMTCNSNIYFNKLCLDRGIIPNYIHKTVRAPSPAAYFTKMKTQQFMIKASSVCVSDIYLMMTDLDSRRVL
jgi:hypothetical protein